MQITQKYIPVPSLRRSGIKINPIKYIVCHDTGNDGSTAAGNVNYYITSANVEEASAHVFVDDIGAIWCIPETEKAWHVRYSAGIAPNVSPTFMNDCALSVELCFGSTWKKERNLASYMNYVTLIASLCKKYSLNPDTALVPHAKLDPTRRTDPYNAFGYTGKLWAQFVKDVKTAIANDVLVDVKIPKSIYDRVMNFINSLI